MNTHDVEHKRLSPFSSEYKDQIPPDVKRQYGTDPHFTRVDGLYTGCLDIGDISYTVIECDGKTAIVPTDRQCISICYPNDKFLPNERVVVYAYFDLLEQRNIVLCIITDDINRRFSAYTSTDKKVEAIFRLSTLDVRTKQYLLDIPANHEVNDPAVFGTDSDRYKLIYQFEKSILPDEHRLLIYNWLYSKGWSFETDIYKASLLLDIHTKKEHTGSLSYEYCKSEMDKCIGGLEEIKHRICCSLVANSASGKRILLVGPPGTGKSALSKCIMNLLPDPYEKLCCSSLRLEDFFGCESYFHNSQPGSITIIEANHKSAYVNLLLDEFDKIYSSENVGSRGLQDLLADNYFYDKFLQTNVPYLGSVVATANSLENIPQEIVDRFEVFEVHAYSRHEIEMICKDYMIPKEYVKYSVTASDIEFSDEFIEDLVATEMQRKKSCLRNIERSLDRCFDEIKTRWSRTGERGRVICLGTTEREQRS